jgi:hypothetical protein
MKTLSQVLQQALLRLEEKYYQKKTQMRTEDAASPIVKPENLADAQREVLRRFVHLRGQ